MCFGPEFMRFKLVITLRPGSIGDYYTSGNAQCKDYGLIKNKPLTFVRGLFGKIESDSIVVS